MAQFRPYGVLGEYLEKKIGFELMFIDAFDEPFRFRASLGYHKMTPRMDGFPIAGYGYENGQWTVYPGVFTYTRFHVLNLAAGIDYAPVQFLDDRLSPYAGLGCVGGYLLQEYESVTPGLATISASESVKYVGLQARLGADMAFTDNLGAFLEFNSSWALALDAPNITFAQPGIGVRYTF